MGRTGNDARRHSSELLSSLALRFGPTRRDPVFDRVRPILAAYALAPSRIFGAPGIWTRTSGESRAITFWGAREGGSYRMAVMANPPRPGSFADYRGEWRLERLRGDEFEWMALEELALGHATLGDLSRFSSALLRGAGSSPPGEAAALLRSELPRTAAALGRLMSLDSLLLRKDAFGCTEVAVEASLHPNDIRAFAPLYARYLDDVLMGTRFEATATDSMGGSWWHAKFWNGRMALRLRTQDGHMVPLSGPPRPMPDSVQVTSAGSSKTGIFRSGYHGLVFNLEFSSAPGEKSLCARFPKAPEWDLPFLVPLLLRGALNRPFEGDGAALAFALEETPGEGTVVKRRYRIAVRETWIIRWMGGYVAGAVNEYRRGEEEADRFTAEALFALRDDVLALLAGG